jgi:3D (Asp-Asp-Asp) domain-containing protein
MRAVASLVNRHTDAVRVVVAAMLAAVFIDSGTMRLPVPDATFRHAPVIVDPEPMLRPVIVRPHPEVQARGALDRAPAGHAIRVSLTQYCLRGTTRRGRYVRPGIVAADPRIFPLAHYVEVFLGKRYLGRFLVDDTGGNVLGPTLDIWTPSCKEAERFGRQWGVAALVPRLK